ncbi:two component Fis family sigma54 specific transcriptional regulator [Alteromonas sp. I10]|uniref:sigma-54-dependent transcriptional regulator n=1 Tax=Alteromonas TaxID=226 RepID=UPI000D771983|nr:MULTISPECIES: sigma-54 dependent transcriptional regulator [Alteromonas]MCZ4240460.1 sigma-54 dependent transcriptional regulator [Alteromonas macleodii]PXW74697.1 two component Fis family sigma54 specific transcriptional regulator [Alteromonas sp. I10]
MSIPIYIIDDEPTILNALKQLLVIEGYEVEVFDNAADALIKLDRDWPGVILSDINMPNMDGVTFLKNALSIDAEFTVVMLTGHGDISTAVESMRLGAYDFIEKPFSNEYILDVLKRAGEKRALVLENRALKDELDAQTGAGPRLLGNTHKIKALRRLLMQIKDIPADVLIRGETGSGKDLVARFLHYNSHRRNENFVAINCGAIPETMIESELFGFEAGAFTSAQKKRIGKIEHANGGTFFLDEIESMPMALQIKLLRVLEDRVIEPLGSNRSVDLDIRVIAAAKIDLLELVDKGEFREDLFYRLNVINVEIPPLRERKEDISLLFQHYAALASSRFNTDAPRLTNDQLSRLQQHNWPGNIRELRNAAERFVLMGGQTIFDEPNSEDSSDALTLADKVAQYEKGVLEATLREHDGRLVEVQQELGLPRKTLYDKMRKYGLVKDDFKLS